MIDYTNWYMYLNDDDIIPNDILYDMIRDGFDTTEYWGMRTSQASDAKLYVGGVVALLVLCVLILGGVGVALG